MVKNVDRCLSEILDEVGKNVAEAVLTDLRTGVETSFKVKVSPFLLDAHNSVSSNLVEKGIHSGCTKRA